VRSEGEGDGIPRVSLWVKSGEGRFLRRTARGGDGLEAEEDESDDEGETSSWGCGRREDGCRVGDDGRVFAWERSLSSWVGREGSRTVLETRREEGGEEEEGRVRFRPK